MFVWFCVYYVIWTTSILGATIGFLETEYFAAEGEGTVSILVSLLSGALGRTVSVRVYTEDNTATGVASSSAAVVISHFAAFIFVTIIL